jgi:16S rRNA (uracil1498-N3)-methyltransferase
MRRFFAPATVIAGDTAKIDGPLARRLATVLRLRPGDVVSLFDGSGVDTIVRLDQVRDSAVSGAVIDRRAGPPDPRSHVTLYQSITKGERFDWVVEKATELGVHRIVPTIASRSIARPREGARLDRWRRIATEAAEQCGRGDVPAVDVPETFDAALGGASGIILVPFEAADETAPAIATVLRRRIDELFAIAVVSLFIGPEGGFEPAEVKAAVSRGADIVTMGDRILRSDTAGIVALAMVMEACGELG